MATGEQIIYNGSQILLTPSTRKGIGRCSSVSLCEARVGTLVISVYDDTMFQSSLYYSMGVVNGDSWTVKWNQNVTKKKFGTGQCPSVCLIKVADELYAVECHMHSSLSYCRVGRVDEKSTCVMWGISTVICNGKNPKISGNNNGTVVILVEEACTMNGIHCFTGTVNRHDMTIDQTVSNTINKFGGIEPNIAMNVNTVVAIYRSGVRTISARLGELDGNSRIAWSDSEHEFKTAGKNPAISLDSHGNVVEVHQTFLWKELKISHGLVSKDHKSIVWHKEKTFNGGEYPAVSLYDGIIFEMHAAPIEYSLFYSLGKLAHVQIAI